MRLGLLMMLAALAVSGCASMLGYVDGADYAKVSQKIEWTDDPHMQITKINGPVALSWQNETVAQEYSLRASKGRDGRLMTLQLYVRAKLSEWAFLESAWSEGRQLELVQISREVVSCRYGCIVHEHVAINLDSAALGAYAQAGLNVKIAGKRGDVIINAPPEYFRAFRDALDRGPSS